MALMKWEPYSGLDLFRRQMDRLTESFFGGEPMRLMEERWCPAIDLAETPEEISVKVEAPGVDEKDLSVTLSGNNLMIKGERKAEKEEKGKHFHRMEMCYGNFERVIPLPVSVDPAKIKAKYENGVLEVSLPKKAEVKPKEIPISTKASKK